MSTIKLNRTQTFNLIKIYKNYEYIWNPKNEYYKRSDLKRRAWQDIANRFKCSIDDIKKKIRYLRSAYIFEKRKVDDCARLGGTYEPNLFYYSELDFLKPTIASRRVTDFGDDSTCNGFDDTETSERFYNEEMDRKPFVQGDDMRNYLQLKELAELTGQQLHAKGDFSDEPNDQKNFFESDETGIVTECVSQMNSFTENHNKDDGTFVPTLKLRAIASPSKSDENGQLSEIAHQLSSTLENHNKDDSNYVPPLKIKILPPASSRFVSRHSTNSPDNVTHKEHDLAYHMTKVWTDKLRNMSNSQRILAEKAINDIIFKGQLEMLTIENVQQFSAQSHSK